MPTTVQSLVYPGIDERYVEPKYVMPLFESWNGSGSTPAMLTGMLDNDQYAMALRNRGSGGALNILDTLDAMLMSVDDSGTSLTNLFGSGTASIDGDTTLGGMLEVAGDAALGGALEVAGDTILQGQLEVVGAVTLEDTLEVLGVGTFADDVDIEGALTVVDAVTLEDTLAVTGPATFDGAVTLGNAPADLITIAGHLPGGTAAAPALRIGEAGTGVWWPQTGELAASLLGVERLRLSTAGLGIGTTALVPPLRALHVVPTGFAPTLITTGSGPADAILVDGVTAPGAQITLVVAAGTGNAVLRASTPTTPNRGRIYWSEVGSEWVIVAGPTGGQVIKVGVDALGFFNTPSVPQQTVPAAATATLASIQGLANALRDLVLAYGLAV